MFPNTVTALFTLQYVQSTEAHDARHITAKCTSLAKVKVKVKFKGDSKIKQSNSRYNSASKKEVNTLPVSLIIRLIRR